MGTTLESSFKNDVLAVAKPFDSIALATAVGEMFPDAASVTPTAAYRLPPDSTGPVRYSARQSGWVHFLLPSAPPRGEPRRSYVRSIADRAARFVQRFVRKAGWEAIELNVYREYFLNDPEHAPTVQIFYELMRAEEHSKYSHRERRHKRWWLKPPVEHGHASSPVPDVPTPPQA